MARFEYGHTYADPVHRCPACDGRILITPKTLPVWGGSVPAGEDKRCENGCPSWSSGTSGW
jgi:hypothetical protein